LSASRIKTSFVAETANVCDCVVNFTKLLAYNHNKSYAAGQT